MNFKDILQLTRQNLLRRKARTLLTLLGVVIGCCAIVIMISIGIGTKRSQEQMLSQMGDLTIIHVSAASGNNKTKLDQKLVAQLKALPSVVAVSPKLSLELGNPVVYAGSDQRFVAEGIQLVGMDPQVLEQFGYQLQSGKMLHKANPGVLIGQDLEYNFQDQLRPEGHNMVDRYAAEAAEDATEKQTSQPPAYFDAMQTGLRLELELKDEKKLSFDLPVQGRLRADNAKGFESSEGLIMPIDYLESILKRSGLEGDRRSGYPTVLVKVTGIDQVSAVEQKIQRMGFSTHSMESIRKPLAKEAQQRQLMLGGLGGISLLVAAIGITNTMVMSISERTKEIGIMKALGCYVRDIRLIFLAEAASIGLIGGMLGSIISLIISWGMNLAARQGSLSIASDLLDGASAQLSVIPIWLLGFAVLFSLLIGLISGYYPANKAVKISALEAIRSE